MDFERYDSVQLISVTDFVEEYYKMIKSLYLKSADTSAKNNNNFDGYLLPDDQVAKEELLNVTCVPNVSKALLDFIICMEWHTDKYTPTVSHRAVYDALVSLECAIAKSSTWEILGFENDDEGPLSSITDFEVNMLEQVVSCYIVLLLNEGQEETIFFPLNNGLDENTAEKWRILEKIATVKVIHQKTIYQQKLSDYISRRIQSEVSKAVDKELKKLKINGKSTILQNLRILESTFQGLTEHLTMAIDVVGVDGSLFEVSRCNYFDAVAQALDTKLYPVIQKCMQCLDEYHATYKTFLVNIRDSSIVFYAFYLGLKKLVQCLIDQVKMRSSCGSLLDYSRLFCSGFLELLHVLKAESHFRINRTMLKENEDTILEDKNIFNSTIIILNCLHTVLNEWQELQIDDEELKIAFLVKITDTVCDGAKIFAEAAEQRAENANLYIKEENSLQKICILANSVERVRVYLSELPQLMHWSEELSTLEGTPSTLPLKKQILRILELMHQSMDSDLKDITSKILQLVVLHVWISSDKYLSSWFNHSMPSQNVEKFLSFLHDQLSPIHCVVNESLFKIFIKDLWLSFLDYTKNHFQEGHNAEYARRIRKNVDELKKYLIYCKMEMSEEANSAYSQVRQLLNLNSKTTVELQLDYYCQLADMLISPLEYLGHIAFQAGYKKSGREVIDLHVKVQKAQRIPVRKFEMSDLTVTVDLCPPTIFPNVQSLRTQPVSEELDYPVFNEIFEFNKLSATVLNIKGAVIQLLVFNQDCSYSAEAVLNFDTVQNMSNLVSMDFLPVYLMPLRRFDGNQPSFKVLESRSKWDRHAKIFVNKRLKVTRNSKKVLSCIPGKKYMCGLAGK